ncbi:MAG: hypothetical protein ACREM3_23225 [Candidatus Rokuibacteriota bacterium]
MKRSMTIGVVLAVALLVAAVAVAAQPKATPPTSDPTAACADMMKGQGVTDEGERAMREFMESERAPQAMATMMAMARRMGDGDVVLGMTRMMEMMGGRGGMMGGDGGMMQPGARQPGK